MTKMSEAEYQALLAKMARHKKTHYAVPVDTWDEPDPGPESVLQGKIMKYCKESGFPCLCFRQSKKAKGFLVPGWPD